MGGREHSGHVGLGDHVGPRGGRGVELVLLVLQPHQVLLSHTGAVHLSRHSRGCRGSVVVNCREHLGQDPALHSFPQHGGVGLGDLTLQPHLVHGWVLPHHPTHPVEEELAPLLHVEVHYGGCGGRGRHGQARGRVGREAGREVDGVDGVPGPLLTRAGSRRAEDEVVVVAGGRGLEAAGEQHHVQVGPGPVLLRPGGEHGGQLGDLLAHQGGEILMLLQHELLLLLLEVLEVLVLQARMVEVLVVELARPLLGLARAPSASSASNH